MNMPPRVPYRFREKSLRKLPKVLTLYYGQNKTVQEVSKELKMNPMTVSNLLKEYGKGLRPKNTSHYLGISLQGKKMNE